MGTVNSPVLVSRAFIGLFPAGHRKVLEHKTYLNRREEHLVRERTRCSVSPTSHL